MRRLGAWHEANIEYAIRVLRTHRFDKYDILGYPKGQPTEQDLLDVEALLRWREHRKAIRNHAGATQQAFIFLGMLRLNAMRVWRYMAT